jgi:selenocysteine lyase/cysteine desulfurase
VTATARDSIALKEQPWHIKPAHFFEETEKARLFFSKLVHAAADDVTIIPSVSYGISIATALLDLRAGDEILLLAEQFPYNVYPWISLAERTQSKVMTVQRPSDYDWTSAILQAVTARTKVVALAKVHWTDGSLVDLHAISARCRQAGIALVIDGTQSIGAMPFSVPGIQPDFLVAAAYKWLLGPYSYAFMYVDPAYHDREPIEHNWINRLESENFAGLVSYKKEYQPGARRFDVGEKSNFALTPMMTAALEQIVQWDVHNIATSLAHKTAELASRLTKLGLTVIPEDKRAPHILGVRFQDGKTMPAGIDKQLARANVFVSLRGNAIRISPHLYNNDADIDALVEVLSGSIKS